MHTRGKSRGRVLFVLLDWHAPPMLETVRSSSSSSSSSRGYPRKALHSPKGGAVCSHGLRLQSICMLTSLCACRRLTLEWQRGAGKRGWLQPATATMGHAGVHSEHLWCCLGRSKSP